LIVFSKSPIGSLIFVYLYNVFRLSWLRITVAAL